MNKKWAGLLAIMPSIGMVFVDQSILPVALPTIQKHFGASNMALWWSVNSYILVSAVFLLVGGKLGDHFGYRKILSIGMGVFAFASALCGISMNILWLILSRALQGIGAALMLPASSPLIMSLFSRQERGKAVGINTSISSLFLIFGPLIGGYFTQSLSWRWIFWINIPISILGILLLHRFIERSAKVEQKFDLWGFVFFLFSSCSLITLIMQGGVWGWLSIHTLIFFAIFFTATFLLLLREKKSSHPFIDLALFRHPVYTAVSLTISVTTFVLMINVYRVVYFQNVLHWSPTESGVVLFFSTVPILFMSPIGGWLADKSGPKIPLSIGFISLIFSFFWLAFFVKSSLWMPFLGLIAFSMGIALIFTPSYSSAMNAVPVIKAGSAFGVLSTIRSLASSMGIAAIAAFVIFVETQVFVHVTHQNPNTKFLDTAYLKSVVQNPSQIDNLPSEEEKVMRHHLVKARKDAFFAVHMVMGVLLIITFLLVISLYNRKSSHHLPESPAEGWD